MRYFTNFIKTKTMRNQIKFLTLIIFTSLIAFNCSNESATNNDIGGIDNTGDVLI